VRVAFACALAAVVGLGCGPGPTSTATPSATAVASAETSDFVLASPVFANGGSIPLENTCDGDDLPIALQWSGTPPGTVEFALVMDDPDAGGFVHWVVVDIPAAASSMGGAQGLEVGRQGRNGRNTEGYIGPCPPTGTHTYVFTLYALSRPMALSSIPSGATVRTVVADRTLAVAELTGVYAREP
jgi:Raf kinase inhibitor-like YbhB/YbcL family protein